MLRNEKKKKKKLINRCSYVDTLNELDTEYENVTVNISRNVKFFTFLASRKRWNKFYEWNRFLVFHVAVIM